MKTEPVSGAVTFTVTNLLRPWSTDPEDYYAQIEVKITVMLDDDAEVTAGTMSLTLLKVAEANHAGVDAYQIFDSHSQSLVDTYGALFDTRGRLRKRHRIERRVEDYLYIDRVSIHRDFDRRNLLAQSVETAIALLAPNSIVFAYSGDINKYGLRWEQHGFKSAGSGIILRDNWDLDPDLLAIAQFTD